MGLPTATIERLAGVAPLEAEDGLPPVVSVRSHETLYVVGRWNEEGDPGPLLRNFIRLVYWWTGGGVCLQAQDFEHIGVASTEGGARAACLDSTYFCFPSGLDHFLPREPVNIKGLSFPRRHLHRLLWHREPEQVETLVLVRESEAARVAGLESKLDKMIADVRDAL